MSLSFSAVVRRATAALGAAALVLPLVASGAVAATGTSPTIVASGAAIVPVADPRLLMGAESDDDESTGVVLVSTTVGFGAGQGAGTGLVLDGDEGVLVTNHHVVEGANWTRSPWTPTRRPAR